MHRLRTVTSLDVRAVAGHHAMPAALLLKQQMNFMSFDILKCFKVLTSSSCGSNDVPELTFNFSMERSHMLSCAFSVELLKF